MSIESVQVITAVEGTPEVELLISTAGEVNTATNTGTGAGVFKAKDGTQLQFKSLVEGNGVTITEDNNEITLSADAGDLTTTDIAEGTNLYYTDAKVSAYLVSNEYATTQNIDDAISAIPTVDLSNYATLAYAGSLTTTATADMATQTWVTAQGYLTSYTETDPVFTASPAGSIVEQDKTNWNTSYGWGNHNAAGYLTSYTETDPVYSASPAASISATDIAEWNGAVAWGDHAAIGYLTSTDIAGKADRDDVYTKLEIDAASGGYADVIHNHSSLYYEKPTVDSMVDDMATQTWVNTQAYLTAHQDISGKADSATTLAGYAISDAYTKTQTDTALAVKADASTVYTQSEIDSLLTGTSASGHNHNDIYYTETEVDSALALKANAVDVYTKTNSDARYLQSYTETTTNLSVSGNTLSYTNEAGNTTNVDLSLYLDDTNAARITSGTIDAQGVVTFTRDDATTFTVDMSQFFDDTDTKLTDAIFNAGTGQVTFSMSDNSVYGMNLDGRYSLDTHTHDYSAVYAPLAHSHTKANISDFNDADYAAAAHNHNSDYYTKAEVDNIESGLNASVADKANSSSTYTKSEVDALIPTVFSGSYNDLTDTPTPFSESYNDLTDKPVAFSESYNDLTDTPTLFDGAYSSLTGTPTLFDAQYSSLLNKPTLFDGAYSSLTGAPTLFSESYNDLTDKPTIPTVPTDVSAFTNDSGYLTAHQDISAKADTATTLAGYGITNAYTTTEVDNIVDTADISWSQIVGAPAYITTYTVTETDVTDHEAALNIDYSQLTNTPTIPTVPTTVSTFSNDAGYLTAHQSLADYSTTAETTTAISTATADMATQTWTAAQNYITGYTVTLGDVTAVLDEVDGGTF